MKHNEFRAKPLTAAIAIVISLGANQAYGDSEERLLSEIVVTGRAGAGELSRSEASYAISTLSADDLSRDNPLSVADIFKSVPGFWVESSGGEASNNIRTRGIPRDGWSSIALLENGIAVQHDGGLGWLNSDQSFRLDETVERVEVVRGGPSAVFASNAPGGVANFITRKPYDEQEGTIKFEVGDYGHSRLDGFFGGPVGNNMFASVGGFYRKNDGIRDPGFTANEGGQIRFSAGGIFDRGEFFVDLKHMNDKVAFLLPIPLTSRGGDVAGIPGVHPNTGTLMGPEVKNNVFRDTGDGYRFDLSRGTNTELTQFTTNLKFFLGDWVVQNNFRYRESDIIRNGLFPGGVQPAQQGLDSFTASLGDALPAGSEVELRFASDGRAFDVQNNAGNGLVFNGNLLSVNVPLDEMINDLRFSRQFDFGSQSHDISLGIYYADYDYAYQRYMATALLEVRDQARLLDVVAVNDGNDILNVTENGILRYGSLYDNVQGKGETLAFYVANEWQVSDALRIDAGLRYEMIELGGQVEGQTTVNLEQSDSLADNQFITGTGEFTAIDRDYEELAWTLGVNYQFNDELGVFARYTDSFRTPNASDFNGNPNRTDDRVEPITMAELGLKYAVENLEIYATTFRTEYEGVRFTDAVFDNATNSFVQRVAFGDTSTIGLELEGRYFPSPYVDLSIAATLQEPEYKSFSFTELVGGEPVERDFGGNQLIRVPDLAVRAVAGVNLLNNTLRAEVDTEYFADRFADVANSVVLPSYYTLGAMVRYQVNDQFTLQVNGKNLTNEIGLTEGNPRAGQFVSGDQGAENYLARPILGRSFTASLRYSF